MRRSLILSVLIILALGGCVLTPTPATPTSPPKPTATRVAGITPTPALPGLRKAVKLTAALSPRWMQGDPTLTTMRTWSRRTGCGPGQLLGYGRPESETLLSPINALYTEAWGPLHNFFLPSMKLVDKWREGSRWRDSRRPDARSRQPIMRLLAHGDLRTKGAARSCRIAIESLDPFVLAAEVEKRLKPILGAALAPRRGAAPRHCWRWLRQQGANRNSENQRPGNVKPMVSFCCEVIGESLLSAIPVCGSRLT